MSGGYISCATFHGNDKSGSAYEGVLEALATMESGRFAALVGSLRDDLNDCSEYVLIPREVAADFLPVVSTYREQVEAELGGVQDPFEIMARDEEAGLDPIEAKWGKGTGWRYYCVLDLQKALGTSLDTGEPVCITFD